MKASLTKFVEAYTKFTVGDKAVAIPYSIAAIQPIPKQSYDMGRTSRFNHYGAKGSPDQVSRALGQAARQHQFSLSEAKPNEITEFMIKHGIGVDCSGFVYNVLDGWLRANAYPPLNRQILRTKGLKGKLEQYVLGWRWVRRAGAATLTSPLNTIKIQAASDVRPGDLLRLKHDRWQHIAIVVAATPKRITYAHSSEYTKIPGPHTGYIIITQPQMGLEAQDWHELTYNGKNYGKYAFNPNRGDAVRRLKYLAER